MEKKKTLNSLKAEKVKIFKVSVFEDIKVKESVKKIEKVLQDEIERIKQVKSK